MTPSVLVDSSSHHLLNLGDVAMLQVCVSRLRESWPNASIGVVVDDEERLRRYCPDVDPVPAAGRYAWFREPSATGKAFPRPRRTRLGLGRARRSRRDPALAAYLEALHDADLFVLSGRGGFSDAFPDEALVNLEELRLAKALGARTAAMSLGVGPLSDPYLRRRAAAILPSVDLVAVRESTFSPGILTALGVPAERIVTTGDDALAPLDSAADDAADAIGVNVRVVAYAGTTSEDVEALSSVVASLSAALGAPLVPVPISTHPHEDDSARLEDLGISGPAPSDPAGVIALARRCRVVVTGSYHAAVFALGQGIPAVCLAASPYYELKFGGLRGMFGRWCEVVQLGAPDAFDQVRTLVARAHHAWPAPRRELVAAAGLQVEAGVAAYKRLAALELGGVRR